MEINRKIFEYAFSGISFGGDRSVIPTLENVLLELGVAVDYSFDTSSNHYYITSIKDELFMGMTPNTRTTRTIVSPYEYLCVLLNQEVNINWFKQLKEGDSVKIGRCHPHEYYVFGFDDNLVRKFFGKEVTISKIVNGTTSTGFAGYSNGDSRAYCIEEIGQFVPSSVFVPQFTPIKPVQKINLISCFIDIDNGLK